MLCIHFCKRLLIKHLLNVSAIMGHFHAKEILAKGIAVKFTLHYLNGKKQMEQ